VIAAASRDTVAVAGTELVRETLRGDTGPTVALLGGVHGDEPEGVAAVRAVLAALRRRELRGTVRAVAIANPLAHAADARCTPADDGDLARAFPGAEGAGPTPALAHALTAMAIAGADLLVDLHSAGRRYAMPLFCGYPGAAAERAARAFAAPLTWAHEAIGPGRSLSAAAALGVPAIYAESSGGGEVRGPELDALAGGVLRVLADAGMIDGAPPPSETTEPEVVRGGDGDLDRALSADVDGLLVTRSHAGARVRAGDSLAEVLDAAGTSLQTCTAPRDGIVMLLRRDARIRRGDGVALVAPTPERW
jgi:predicted deacylase